MKAMALMETDDYQAFLLFKEEVEQCPENGYALFMMGHIMYTHSALNGAFEAINDAIEQLEGDDPWMCMCHHLRGRIEMETDKEDEALEDFATALAYYPEDVSVYDSLAYLYIERQNYYEEIKCLREAYRIDPNPERLELIGDAYYYIGDFSRSVFFIRKTIGILGETFELREKLAYRLAHLGCYDESLREYMKCNMMKPDTISVLVGIANMYLHMRDFENARRYAVRASSLDQSNSAGLLALANIYGAFGKTDTQRAVAERILKKWRASAHSVSLALIMLERFEEADEHIKQRLEYTEDPYYSLKCLDKAFLLAKWGKKEESMKVIQEVQDFDIYLFDRLITSEQVLNMHELPEFEEVVKRRIMAKEIELEQLSELFSWDGIIDIEEFRK